MTFSRKVLLVIITTIVALSLRLSSAMDICKEKDKPGFKLKLLGTALFKDYLLLITRDDNHQDYTVYKVPLDKFDNSYGQMLLDIAGVPIEEYWPAFKTDPNWKAIREYVISIWLVDKVKPYLYFFVPDGHTGNTLEVNNGTWVGGLDWAIHPHIATQWISNSDASHTYTNKCNDEVNGVYFLYAWDIHLNPTGQYNSSPYKPVAHLYYTENKATNKVENITFVCAYDSPKSIITPEHDPYRNMTGYEDYRLVNLTDWNASPDYVPPGFIYNGQFHMFAQEKVFIFADRLSFKNPGLKVGDIWYSTPVKAVEHKDYFKCRKADLDHATYPPRPAPVTLGSGGGSLLWLWILVAILLGLLLVVLLLWMYCRKKKKSKGHRHHGGHKKGSSRNSVGTRAGSPMKGPSSLKQATSLKRNGSLKRKGSVKSASVKLSHATMAATQRSIIKAK